MTKLAPIALFCFKRLETLERCLESLKNCPESSFSDLIIFSDSYRNEEEKEKVEKVRSFCDTIDGFNSIRVIYRKENLGVDYNIIQGIKEMATEHESFIIVEDDLIVSAQFLHFMNSSLIHFKNFKSVLTISAFNYVKIPRDYIWDCYFAARTNPWGWATWSQKIKNVDWDLAFTENFLTNPQEMKDFNAWGSDRSRMLRRTLQGEIRAWDVRLDYFQFKMGHITAYSRNNLVNNIGFNDPVNASNTTGYNRFKTNVRSFHTIQFKFPEFILTNKEIARRYVKQNNLYMRLVTTLFKKLKIYNR